MPRLAQMTAAILGLLCDAFDDCCDQIFRIVCPVNFNEEQPGDRHQITERQDRASCIAIFPAQSLGVVMNNVS